jgi:hypothetical protein
LELCFSFYCDVAVPDGAAAAVVDFIGVSNVNGSHTFAGTFIVFHSDVDMLLVATVSASVSGFSNRNSFLLTALRYARNSSSLPFMIVFLPFSNRLSYPFSIISTLFIHVAISAYFVGPTLFM